MTLGTGVNGQLAWVAAHEELVGLAKRRAEFDWREGTALLQALRAEVHRHLGMASFAEYVERLFGYGPRTTEDKLRTAAALESLPELDRSLRDGELSWSAVRELARVATPATERDWLDAARGKTVRQIERLVSGHVAGDKPSDPARAGAERHVLRFEVSGDTLALFRDAVAHLRRKSTDRLDDDALLLTMAREILQGPCDEGRASYQVAVTTCDQCRRGFQQGAGSEVELEPALLEAAECDSQRVGTVPAPAGEASLGHVSVHESPSHVGEPPEVGEPKAAQDIPPALRRQVMRRDRGCCVVPGCRHGTFVDVHHLKARSEGGAHTADNLVVLCGAHHRAVHRGQLVIEGQVSTGLSFQHAGGAPYGEILKLVTVTNPTAVAPIAEKAFRGLLALGFHKEDAKRAIAIAESTVFGGAVTPEALVRAALARLVDAPPRRPSP